MLVRFPARSAVSGLLLATFAAAQPAGFPSLVDIVGEMNTAAATYSSICRLVDLNAHYGTPLSHGGRPIHAIVISDHVGVEEDEPKFLMVAAHHGNEYGTPIVALDAIARLTRGYGVDPTITALVDEYEIWIAPVWNVDGYPTSRRNGAPDGGVDLNRNYPFLWDSACNNGVKGPSPASEPETRTMLAFAEDRRFTKVLDYHSSGRETLYAYHTGCEAHRLHDYLRDEAVLLATASSYATRGPSSNGEHYQWQLGTYANYAFLTEISNTQSPTRASADAEATTLWPGTLWMLQRPIPVQGHVTDAITGLPLEADIRYVESPFTQGERNRSEPRFGRYHAFLPVGTHTLRFSRPGYVSQEIPVTVTAGGIVLDVALTPPGLSFAFPQGLPAQVRPAGGTTVRVDVLPALGTPQAGSGLLHVSSANETRTVPMTELAANTYEVAFPAFACGDVVRFSFSAVDTTGQPWTSPENIAPTVHTLRSVSHDDFEAPSGWAGGQPGDTASTGIWSRMDPEPTASQPGDDHTPSPGTMCWVTDGRAGSSVGAYDVDGGATTLLSPRLDLSAMPDAVIGYWRWFSNHGNAYRDDVLRVDISADDGLLWTNVETVGPGGVETEGGWFEHTFRAGDFVTPSATTRVRFVAEDTGSGSLVEAAIDDFAVFVPECDGALARRGRGCPDATGQPLQLAHTGSVRLGTTLELGASSGSALPFVVLGGPAALVPAPIIPGTGSPGCSLFVAPEFAVGPIGSGATLTIAIPSTPALAGVSLYWQAAMADPGLAWPIRAATSDYLVTTFGS